MTEKVKELQKLVAILTQKVNDLTRENMDLRHRLSKYEHPKNSNNSSIPPSKDENRPKRKSLREPSGLKPGGQKGRKGNTLKMVETPDITQKHIPHYCKCCGIYPMTKKSSSLFKNDLKNIAIIYLRFFTVLRFHLIIMLRKEQYETSK